MTYFLVGLILSVAALALLRRWRGDPIQWPDALLRAMVVALVAAAAGPAVQRLAAERLTANDVLGTLLYFVASIPLAALAYVLNRTRQDSVMSALEILLRSSLTAVIMTALVAGSYALSGLAFERHSIEFFGVVAAAVIPLGGAVMTWTFAFDEWTQGGTACLTYLALPACVALVILVQG